MTTPFPFVAAATLTAAQMNAITTIPISTKTASYTAVVGDVGSRLIMNVASSNTLTINNSIFSEGDTIFCANKGDGTTTITAGAGVTINGTLTVAQHGGGTLVALSASVFTFFPSTGSGYGVATGGTSSSITVSGTAYTLLSITTDTNLVVSRSGLFDVVLVAGGGGAHGGESPTSGGGGGGGGGVIGLSAVTTTIYLPAATYAVDVGAGGSGASGGTQGGTGLNSAIASVISAAGGGGAGKTGYSGNQAGSGASGAGGSNSNTGGVSNQSIAGNVGGNSTANSNAGGGGGAAAVGGNGSSTTGGAGGNGSDISTFISGATSYAGAGGGGGATGTGGAAGNGGVAGKITGAGNNGVNYGAGGGGTMSASAGGSGAAGAIFVRFKI